MTKIISYLSLINLFITGKIEKLDSGDANNSRISIARVPKVQNVSNMERKGKSFSEKPLKYSNFVGIT